MLTGTFEGAGTGRRLNTWGMSTSGPNASIFGSLSTLRSRSRELTRNNPLASGAIDSFVSNLIGSGISPRWQLDDIELKKQIQELWADSTEEIDAAGLTDFYGLEAMVAHSVIESGEVLVRFRPRLPEYGYAVPLQLQILEADHLDESFNTVLSNGNEVRMGIEFNKIGQKVAYHLFREHPGEFYHIKTNDRVRIPASEILHIGRPLRPGQIRYRPWLSSVIVRLHELDQYQDAELVRKKSAAMFGGFITELPGDDTEFTPLGKVVKKDTSNRDIVALEPGTFPILPPGMDVKFSEPADVGGNYEKWIKQELRSIARGIGITYEQLTGDLSGVNYSSIRAGLIEFRRLCIMLQKQLLSFQFCGPVARRWLDTAVMSGALTIPSFRKNRRRYYRIKWRPDGFAWVDPEKDQKAEQMAVRNGFKSRSQVVAELGHDIEMLDAEIAEDNKRTDKLDLVFDSDPRKTAKTGTSQTTSETNLSEDNSDEQNDSLKTD
ncbi:MAG: phage portal protein [Proteobacteria bacterium]|nr:phage portal protein [Pseudomonadota bacterium]